MKNLIVLFLVFFSLEVFAQQGGCHDKSHFAAGQTSVNCSGGTACDCVDLVLQINNHVYAWNNSDRNVEFTYDSDLLHKGSIKIIAKPHTSVALSWDAKNIKAN